MPINNPSADEIVMQRHLRIFSQRGGPIPANRIRYSGPDEQYMSIGDVKDPVRGSLSPVRVHDPRQRGLYRLIGMETAPPDLAGTTISFLRKHGGISWISGDLSCPNNYYELAGECGEPDDFLYGWRDFVTIYSYGIASNRTNKARTSMSEDKQLMDDVEHVFAAVYDIGGLSFTDNVTPTKREVVDLVFGSRISCGNCGPADDGTQRLYALSKSSGAGSPGTPAEVLYTNDRGRTWAMTNITGLSGTQDPTAIAIAGSFLIVLDTVGNGYYWAQINPWTGVPGAWTNVTAGFVANKQPNDIVVVSPTEVWFCGEGGYIYRSTDITAGVRVMSAGTATTNDLKRIDVFEDIVVSVGESGTIVVCSNRGSDSPIFVTAPVFPTSNTLNAVDVRDQFRWWITGGGGGIWYTLDGGNTWTQVNLGATLIDDIAFATDEVGYIVGRAPNSTTARLWTTFNGGFSWVSSAVQPGNPRILNFLTYQRSNRIAVPLYAEPSIAANVVALGGLNADGTNGNIIIGAGNVR